MMGNSVVAGGMRVCSLQRMWLWEERYCYYCYGRAVVGDTLLVVGDEAVDEDSDDDDDAGDDDTMVEAVVAVVENYYCCYFDELAVGVKSVVGEIASCEEEEESRWHHWETVAAEVKSMFVRRAAAVKKTPLSGD
mmetsp:Transcript_4329/g.5546  ORF Transcript_4329/g.5546 Transcript_4329/m.5546 type:complete len:135 (+) Transcript_4329:326-730(+)